MIRLGRMFAVALLLSALMPGIALAGPSDERPLAELPSEYAPALDAAAKQLGVSADKLTSASGDELETLLCSKLDESSAEEIAAGAKEALANAPESELKKLNAGQRAQLAARLPSFIMELEAKYCTTSNGAGGASGGGGDAAAGAGDSGGSESGSEGSGSEGSGSASSGSGATTTDSGIPVPNRVDTGGGGAADGALVPLVFGGLFASLFGLFGVGLVRRQHHT